MNFATLTSATSYGRQRTRLAFDYSANLGTTLGLIGIPGVPYVSLPADNDVRKFTQEIRLASPSSSTIDYVLGAYYTHEKSSSLNGGYGYTATGALAPAGCAAVRLPPHERDMARRMMRAYEAMGCEPSWTCAPYQAGHRPAAGSDVAWGESNAVVFCNSVLGARTNRYGDFLDIACAVSGRAPDYGLHRPANRLAALLIDVTGLSQELRRSDVFYPVLGTILGRRAGSAVAVIDGLQGCTNEDRLKALGAAAASAGGVGLFHVAGVTPEAPDLAGALGHVPPRERIALTAQDVAAALAGLSTAGGSERIDAVAIGSPHLSLAEIDALE
ncbi:MAG: DUF521 domain-containing protein, partial [Bosea sp.]|nr:DUF521 domain-containing protein [Bosea sp. (in: a-proteobacteria)]